MSAVRKNSQAEHAQLDRAVALQEENPRLSLVEKGAARIFAFVSPRQRRTMTGRVGCMWAVRRIAMVCRANPLGVLLFDLRLAIT